MERWSNLGSNLPKMKLEIQQMCSTCFELRKLNELLSNKCHIYERQIENLGKINAENGRSLQESQRKIAKQDQVVALLTQQMAEKIGENSMLRVENDANKGGKVRENNLPDIDKFLEIKMNIPNEDNLREKKETNKEQDVENCSEMENSENSDDIQVFEEAEDEETEATLDEKQVLTCAWMVRDDKGTSALCGRVFPSAGDLASHFKEDHLNANSHGNYICSWDGCKRNGEPFKNRRILSTHFRVHSGERPYQCPFEGCNEAFAQMTLLRRHSSTIHSKTIPSKTTYPCLDPECPKVFRHKKDMMVHYRVRHTGERKGFACPVEDCGRVFDYKHVLAKHMTTHRPYQCRFPRCYQSFASRQNLDEHSETHEAVAGGHECTFDGCSMKFPDARAVREHVRITHTGETPYVCPYGCRKAFSTERGLKLHLIVHAKETDTVEPP